MDKTLGMTPETMHLFDRKLAGRLYGLGKSLDAAHEDSKAAAVLDEGTYLLRRIKSAELLRSPAPSLDTIGPRSFLMSLSDIQVSNQEDKEK